MRVLVTDDNVWPWLRDSPELAARGVRLDFVPYQEETLVRGRMRDADAYVGVLCDAQLARAAGPDFAFVQITAAGTDHIALAELPPHIPVCNAYGHGRSIAEHVLMVVLAVRRRLLWRDQELRRGRWRTRMLDPGSPTFRTLTGVTVGIIGFGHIGRAIARLCRAVGMVPIAVRRSAAERDRTDPGAEWVDGMGALGELLDGAEVVVVACPLTEETHGLIGEPELRRLGPAGVLVNVGRGQVVDERALYAALAGGTIAGAALDVWHNPASAGVSPPSELPFAELDNVVMTPHYSATADNTYAERAEEVIGNLVRAHSGEPLRNIVRAGWTKGERAG